MPGVRCILLAPRVMSVTLHMFRYSEPLYVLGWLTYPVPVQYMFTTVLDIRGGLVGVWVRIYIYIAIPKVVRVWQFTVLKATMDLGQIRLLMCPTLVAVPGMDSPIPPPPRADTGQLIRTNDCGRAIHTSPPHTRYSIDWRETGVSHYRSIVHS